MKLRTECITFGGHQPGKVNKSFEIPKITLESLLDLNFAISDISNMLCVSESIIYRRMRQFNLSKHDFPDIDDSDLDNLVENVTNEFPYCGETMLRELLLQRHGLKIQRYRLRESLHRTNEQGITDRRKRRLHRRVYSVQSPNFLWYIDTNHKLIRWNFIIAAGIDGFSRLVTFVECTNNNKASTLLQCFLKGVSDYGLPLRVRSDKGLENIRIAEYMIANRGETGMLTGKSTHNQRVERLWRDMYEGVLAFYHNLFTYLEDEGMLDIFNDDHLYALHHVYRPKINEKRKLWQFAWGNHRIRTVNSIPLRMFSAGVLNNPVEVPMDYMNAEIPEQFDPNRPFVLAPSVHISERCQHQLNLLCPASWTSTMYGIDVYKRSLEIISAEAGVTGE